MTTVGAVEWRNQRQTIDGAAENLQLSHRRANCLMRAFRGVLTSLLGIADSLLVMQGTLLPCHSTASLLPRGMWSVNLCSVLEQTAMLNGAVLLKVLSRQAARESHSARLESRLDLLERGWMLTDGDRHNRGHRHEGGSLIVGLEARLLVMHMAKGVAMCRQVHAVAKIRVIQVGMRDEALAVVRATTGDMELTRGMVVTTTAGTGTVVALLTGETAGIRTGEAVALGEMLVGIRTDEMAVDIRTDEMPMVRTVRLGGQGGSRMCPLQGDMKKILVQAGVDRGGEQLFQLV